MSEANRNAYIILGATGHIGSVVAESLLSGGHDVIAVVRDDAKAESLKDAGAKIAVVDVADTERLRATLQRGRRAFLLNPPAPVTGDTDVEENGTAQSIAEALLGSGLEKVLVESTYGAQRGEAIGDLSVLWNFERAVAQAMIPTAVNRGAYYFTNLDMLLDEARDGTISTMFPAHLAIPMVAPADLGLVAAKRLANPVEDIGLRYVEGAEHYSFDDVAAAFADALGHAVTVKTIERADWEASFRQAGFSESAARAYTRMTEASLEGFEMPEDPLRGATSLGQHISNLVNAT